MPELTSEQRWLSRRYLIYRVVTNLWFFEAVWLYFYRLFITDQQTGMLDGIAFAIGLLAEVPSGALADRFGRDRMVRLGQILAGSGILLQAAGSTFVPFVVGQAVMMIGVSLVSGADDALFFERLKFKADSAHWRKLQVRGSQCVVLGSLIAMPLGSWLHTINPRVPWVLNGLAFFAAAALVWPITDSRPRKARQALGPELRGYLHDIATGFQQFRLPKLLPYALLIIFIQGLFYIASYGILRLVLMSKFHISPLMGGVLLTVSGLTTLGLLALIHHSADRLSEKRVVATVGLAAVASLLLALTDAGIWGFGIIFVLYVCDYIFQPFLSEVLNRHALEEQRATVLSVASFLRTIPYVILAPTIGYLSTRQHLEYFLVPWAILVAAALAFYLVRQKQDVNISLPED